MTDIATSVRLPEQAAFSGWIDLAGAAGSGFRMIETDLPGRRCYESAGARVAVDAGVQSALAAGRLAIVAGAPAWRGATRIEGESIAQAVARTGGDALAALGGRFSLVLIDPGRASVLLATDRFACYPLCFSAEGGRIAFSDRADSLAADAARAIDPQALLRYLYFHCLPAPATMYRGVQRLSIAERVEIDRQGVRRTSHWLPAFAERWPLPAAERAPRFRQIVAEAVRAEVGERGNVGAYLSGGTDSSTVTGMLREVTGKAPRAYSIGFDAEGYDEMSYARIAARRFGAEHREYYVTPDDLVAAIPRVAASYDQPFGNSSALPAYYCARMAHDDGVGHLLAGDGGDELFGGNARYAKQKVFDAYFRLPAPLRRRLLEPALLGPSIAARIPLVKKARSYIAQATVPMPARMQTYNLLNRVGAAQVLSHSLLAQVDAGAPDREQAATWSRVPDGSLVNRMLAFDWQYTLADSDLPKVRGTAALAGISVGFPMLDDALLDFSLSVPSADKVRGLRLRHFFKEALTGFLPDEILRKSKHGFGLPFGVWLTRHAPLKSLAADSLAGLGRRNVLQPGFLRTVEGHLQTHAGYYGELIWVLMMLEQWLRARAPEWKVAA